MRTVLQVISIHRTFTGDNFGGTQEKLVLCCVSLSDPCGCQQWPLSMVELCKDYLYKESRGKRLLLSNQRHYCHSPLIHSFSATHYCHSFIQQYSLLPLIHSFMGNFLPNQTVFLSVGSVGNFFERRFGVMGEGWGGDEHSWVHSWPGTVSCKAPSPTSPPPPPLLLTRAFPCRQVPTGGVYTNI